MSHVNGIVRIYQQRYIVFHLLFISIVKFFKRGHIFHVPCLYADLLPLIPSVGKYQFQRTAHIVEGRVMPPFRFACLLWLHTADDIVLPGVLQGQAPAQQGGDNHLVIIIGRKPDSRAGQVRRLHQQIMGRLVPHPDRQRWLGQEHMLGGADTHKGQIVGHV